MSRKAILPPPGAQYLPFEAGEQPYPALWSLKAKTKLLALTLFECHPALVRRSEAQNETLGSYRSLALACLVFTEACFAFARPGLSISE